MRERDRRILAMLAVLLGAAFGAGAAGATVLTFENVGDSPPAAVPAGYYGFTWGAGWRYITSGCADTTWGTPNGYSQTMNGTHAVYTESGATITRTSGRFSVASMLLGAAWNDGQYVRIEGRRSGGAVRNWYGVVPFGGGTGRAAVTLNWADLDTLVVTPDAATGTAHAGVSGSGHAVCLDDLTYSASPWIGSITPSSGVRNSSVSVTDLAGTGFVAGAAVVLRRSGQTDIAATDVTVVSEVKITCTLPLAGAATGAWDVVVTNPDTSSGTLAGGFTVSNGPPVLTSVTPPYAPNTSVVAFQVYGSGFLGAPNQYHSSNPRITLRRAGQPDITVAPVNVWLAPDSSRIGLNNFDIRGGAPGVWDVVVTNNDGQSGTLPGAFTIVGPYLTPTVTSITPNSGPNTGPIDVTITGTNFFVPPAPGGPVMNILLNHSGTGNITATNVNVLSSTQLTCTFDLTGKIGGVGSPWHLYVYAPGGASAGSLMNAFTVLLAPPTVTSATPNSGPNLGTQTISDLAGTGFVSGATVRLQKAGETDITAASTTVSSSTKIVCSFNLTGKAPGAWDIVVTNSDGQSATLSGGYTIVQAVPTVTSITPNSGKNTGSVSITNLVGTNFATGATVALKKTGQADINATSVVVASATKITCTLNLTGAAIGPWDVVVTNPSGASGALAGGFTVNPPPTVTSITPSSGLNSGSVNITNLVGTNFLAGATVALRKAGQADIGGTSVVVSSATKITCTFDLTGAISGAWDVVVTNTDGQSGTLPGGFAVNPPPTVTSIAPSGGTNVGTVSITNLAGTNFVTGATVALKKSGQADIAATAVVVSSATKITCNLDLAGAVTGAWDVVVSNTDGQSGTLAGGFTVSAPGPAPTLTSVSPLSAPNNKVTVFQVYGSGFLGAPNLYHASNPRITLRMAGQPDIVVQPVNVWLAPDGSRIGLNNLDIRNAAVGAWDVIVTNNDGQSSTLPGAFYITAPYVRPTVASITPDSGPNTGPITCTITGTGFFVPPVAGAPTMYVLLSHSGTGNIVATNVTATSDTQLTCTFDLTGQPGGVGSPWTLYVYAPDQSTSGSLANAFTVTLAPPTLTSVTPNTALNTGNTVLALAGSGFLRVPSNPAVKLQKAGQADIVATTVQWMSSASVNATVPLAGKAPGAWDVVLTNADGQSASLPAALTVSSPKPVLTSITPNWGTNNGPVAITNLAGSTFAAGMAVALRRTGQPDIDGTNVTVVSATKATCDFDITGAAEGAWDVVATNPGSATTTLAGAFTVIQLAPSVSAITPQSGVNTGPVDITNLAGENFVPGDTVTLQMPGQPDIAATAVTVVSSTKITCNFDITDAAPGAWDVVVADPVGRTGMLAAGFRVMLPTDLTIGDADGRRGDTVDLAAQLLSRGAPVEGREITFTIAGEAVGTGTTGPDGVAHLLYDIPHAYPVGVHTLRAEFAGDLTYVGASGSAAITVRYPEATSITVGPDPEAVAAGQTATYAATAHRDTFPDWDVTDLTTFSISAGAGGSWTGNVYTSSTTGHWTVTGNYEALSDTATLHVLIPTTLRAFDATGPSGQTVPLSAKLTTVTGTALTGRTLAFSVDGTAAGTAITDSLGVARLNYSITSVGVKPISVTFAADTTYAGATGTATLVATYPQPTKITIAPRPPAAITAGASQAFTVTGDNGADLTGSCSFQVSAGAGGSWAGNVYTSSRAGTWTITAIYGALTDSTTLTVNHGPAATVTVTPVTNTITTAQTQAYAVACQDAYGNAWTPALAAGAWTEDGAGGFTDGTTYTPAAGDAGKAVHVSCTVDGTSSNTATLNVTAAGGPGLVLAWDWHTQVFYLCANPAQPQSGTPITASGTYGGVTVTLSVLSSTHKSVTVTNAGLPTNSLRVRWYLRGGAVYLAYGYSTIGTTSHTSTFNGTRTLVDTTYFDGFWGMAHTLDADPPTAVTYSVVQQP